jgi:hypothetical protein
MKMMREKMSEWLLHCAVDQRHIRRSQPPERRRYRMPVRNYFKAAINRIVGPSETINAHKIKDRCAKHRPSLTQSREAANP